MPRCGQDRPGPLAALALEEFEVLSFAGDFPEMVVVVPWVENDSRSDQGFGAGGEHKLEKALKGHQGNVVFGQSQLKRITVQDERRPKLTLVVANQFPQA